MRTHGGPPPTRWHSALAVTLLALAACTTDALAPRAAAPGPPLGPLPEGNPGRIELRRLEARPRLTLVARDGDPAPAVAVVFVTDQGAALTAALAAVVESRVLRAGFDPDVRVDRDAFRVRLALADPARAGALFAALAGAASRPVTPGSPEIALATQRLQSLRRNPLDAPELEAAAACTGALGVTATDPLPDLADDAGLRAVEAARRAALHAGNMAVAAVGPAAFGTAVTRALEQSEGWPLATGAAKASAPAQAAPPWPAADAAGVYTAGALDRRGARLTLAVQVPDPLAAAAAAERLGAPDSPLVARLRLLPEAWRVVQVAGVARARGGCVAVVLETAQHAPGMPAETGAALAAATAQREVIAELAAGGTAAVVGRQILTAADPREAASRAAWWSLAGPAPGAPPRWVTALGIPPARTTMGAALDSGSVATDPAADARFQVEIDRAVASATAAGAERRFGVERGQGELWLLLASPCGVTEEGAGDAGFGALATLAALESHRHGSGVALEPWVTADGLGVIAHAPFRDEREAPADLARRVADVAARVLTATNPLPEAAAAARATLLDHLERTWGPQGTALAALAAASVPDHPSWLSPFGLWSRVAGAPAEGVRLRAQALALGPLRVAVLANADAAQAVAAGDAVDRWLAPIAAPRICRGGSDGGSKPPPNPPDHAGPSGAREVRLPEGAPFAQGLLAAPVPPPGAPERELAELTAAALDGPGGLLAGTLADATGSARLTGGSHAPALVIDVRAPSDALAAAAGEVKALLLRLPTAVTDADLARAALAVERREEEARADPRRRLIDLWAGRPPRSPATTRPSLAGWRTFLAATLRETALTVVEARPQ